MLDFSPRTPVPPHPPQIYKRVGWGGDTLGDRWRRERGLGDPSCVCVCCLPVFSYVPTQAAYIKLNKGFIGAIDLCFGHKACVCVCVCGMLDFSPRTPGPPHPPQLYKRVGWGGAVVCVLALLVCIFVRVGRSSVWKGEQGFVDAIDLCAGHIMCVCVCTKRIEK